MKGFILSVLACMAAGQTGPNNGLGTTPSQRSSINQNQTGQVLLNCVQAAQSIAPENCAVVDPSGLLVGFIRMDNAFPGSIDIAQKKARTAVLFNGMTSAQIGQQAQPGQPLQEIEETNGGLIAFGGGYPIYQGSRLIGGVGASGATVPQDETVAQAAVRRSGFSTTPT